MANKRMFSKQITTSDAFMEMPVSSQLLYFHLNMEADDDGFVANPKRTIKIIGANEDDLKVLLTKRFLLAFESGVVVIKHWLLHNCIRKDMYQETQYLEEKKTLGIKDNSVYTELCNETVTEPLHRLDKIRLDKIKLDKLTPPSELKGKKALVERMKKTYSDTFEEFWEVCPMKKDKFLASESFGVIDPQLYPVIIEAMERQAASGIWTEEKYTPHPATWLNQMRWEDKPLVTTMDPMEAFARELVKQYPLDKTNMSMFKFVTKYGAENLSKVKHILGL